MKKLLLGSSALIAALSLTAPAQAEMEVTVSGFTAFQAAMFDNDTPSTSHRDFQSETEIYVEAKNVTDAGLEYGALVQLEASTSDTTNGGQEYVYLSGDWGRVELGDEVGAGSMAVFAPTVGIGQINGSYDDFVPSADLGHALNNRGDGRFSPIDSEYVTKATYYTPKFAGLQLGVSYVPEVDDMASGEQVQMSKTAGNHRDMVELGAVYERDLEGVALTLGGTYNHAAAKTGAALEDINSWGVGGQIGYEGFTFGGSYTDQGDSGNAVATSDDNVTDYTVGLTYETDDWGVGASYVAIDFNTNGDSGGILGSDGNGGDYSAVVVGGTYSVAPGLTVGADLAFFDRNRDTGADTNGYVLMTDVMAAF